jgi:Yippee zinc-binding/DNA-binding /Mis18, centromere assembly
MCCVFLKFRLTPSLIDCFLVRLTSKSSSQQLPLGEDRDSLLVDGNVTVPSLDTLSAEYPDEVSLMAVDSASAMPFFAAAKNVEQRSPRISPTAKRRLRAHSFNNQIVSHLSSSMIASSPQDFRRASLPSSAPRSPLDRRTLLCDSVAKAKSLDALRINDSMVYLDGPQVYTCAQCRTHMTSHDDIISKSFHGRHGRAYLFDQCVNVTIGPSEDRRLITGLHTVCDIFCKRCKTLVGWTYLKAYESSQKYKEGKYIIEKINLHLEESDYYNVAPPAGERTDRWRQRSMSWGDNVSEASVSGSPVGTRPAVIFEYRPSDP